MNNELITTAQAASILGLPRSTFQLYQRRGYFRACLAPLRLGHRKYLRSKFEQIKAGQSLHVFGKRRAS